MNKQNNGNDQLNSIRNELNDRVQAKVILGNSPRIYFNGKKIQNYLKIKYEKINNYYNMFLSFEL